MSVARRNELKDLAYKLEWGKRITDDELKLVCATLRRAALVANNDTLDEIYRVARPSVHTGYRNKPQRRGDAEDGR